MKLSPFPWKRWADRLRGDANAPPFAKTLLTGLGGMPAISCWQY